MEQPVRNPMGTAPVGTLMRAMGLPIILSMMIQALYNIVDSAFVSNMAGGEAALNALTLAWGLARLVAPDLSNAWVVWLTFPIAEGLTAAIAAGLLARLYRGKIQPMG